MYRNTVLPQLICHGGREEQDKWTVGKKKKEVNLTNDNQPRETSRLHSGCIIFENKIANPITPYEKCMIEVNRQMLGRVFDSGIVY